MNPEQVEALADQIELHIKGLREDFDRGVKAFERGDYKMAQIHFEPGPYEHLIKLLEINPEDD